MILSASLAMLLAELALAKERTQTRQRNMTYRLVDFVRLVESTPRSARAHLLAVGTHGIRGVDGRRWSGPLDDALSAALRARLGPDVRAERAAMRACLDEPQFYTAGSPQASPPDVMPARCWIMRVRSSDGDWLTLSADTYPLPLETGLLLNPISLLVIVLASGALAIPVSRMAAAPLAELARVAGELGTDFRRPPAPETGPAEVRKAAVAFNAMQRLVQRDAYERAHMLAAITHDLQSPITRIRLRLEKVSDAELREKLLADLAAMRSMVREGLELARSVGAGEPAETLDLDALVESVVQDAADEGHDVVFTGGCKADIEARPRAIQRCLANLIDNAVKYGGAAEVACERRADVVVVRVCDSGLGIPGDQIEAMFQPFSRLDASRSRETGGVGLGLSIARNLAEREGAVLTLQNRPTGGIEALLICSMAGRGARSVQTQQTPPVVPASSACEAGLG